MKFFISSTYEDLKDYRKIAIDMLSELECQVICMEKFTASQKESLDYCLKQISDTDCIIGIYGCKYGSVYKSSNNSMTEEEFDFAVKNGISILPFVIKRNDKCFDERQKAFIENSVYKHNLAGKFSDAEDFKQKLNLALKNEFGDLEGYNYKLFWKEINEAEKEMKKDPSSEFRIDSYVADDINSIINYLEQTKHFINQLGDKSCFGGTYDTILSYAYDFYYEKLPQNRVKKLIEKHNYKKQIMSSIETNADAFVNAWDLIYLGVHNYVSGLNLAIAYLELEKVKMMLLNEVWTKDLREKAIAAKDNYINQLRESLLLL